MKAFSLASLAFLLMTSDAHGQDEEHLETSRALADVAELGGVYQQTVTSLSFRSGQKFTGHQLARLAPLAGDLRALDLSLTRTTDQGLRDIYLFPHLTDLDLSQTLITDEAFVHLAALKDLRSLSLAKTVVTGSAFVDLVALKNLRSLDLSDTKIDRQGLASLKIFPSLTTLSLAATDVGNLDIGYLKGAVNLETLILDGTRVRSDAGLGSLLMPLRQEDRLAKLRHVSLSHTRVKDDVIGHFFSTPGIQTLAINYTLVTPKGLRELAEIGEKGYLRNFRSLRVSEEQLTDEVREALETAFPNLQIRIQAGR